MTTVTDFSGIAYAADGSPDISWAGNVGLATPVIVTYSFVEAGDLAGWEAQSSYANNGYTSFTAEQRANFRDVMALYSQAAGIVFIEAASGQGMVNVMDTSGSGWGGWAATAYATTSYTGSGELIVDNSGTYDEGSYGFQTMLHELGHAMGLQHPWEGGLTLDASVDDQAHTVMTYNVGWPYTSQLGTLDVDAMRYLYGDAGAVAGWVTQMAAGVLTVSGSGRGDTILGVAGQNVLNGRAGADAIYGRQADDTLRGDGGNDTLSGSSGADVLIGGKGSDDLFGFDAVQGWGGGNDRLYGGSGVDHLTGSFNADTLVGGSGSDRMDGQTGSDVLHGGLGNDRIFGDGSAADGGNDTLFGDGGNDQLFGGDYQDSLSGGDGNDRLDGGAGFDTLDGGAGNDTLVGHGSNSSETVTGGAGQDVIVFGTGDLGSQYHLTDFAQGQDVLDMRGMGFSFADVHVYGGWVVAGTLWIETTAAGQIAASDFMF